MNHRRKLLIALCAGALAAPFAYSQEYPAQEIHALCNYGPGSGAAW